jgi:hypothetical protein
MSRRRVLVFELPLVGSIQLQPASNDTLAGDDRDVPCVTTVSPAESIEPWVRQRSIALQSFQPVLSVYLESKKLCCA